MSDKVYLNGAFVLYEQALIPVEDRGNVFADGVYEVIRFYGGRPLTMGAHMERLERSADAIRLPAVDTDALSSAGLELVRRNGVEDGSLYLQISRGVAPRSHLFPLSIEPTVFMIARSSARPDADWVNNGVACITAPDNRWLRCDIKSIALLPNILAKQQAKEAGAFEALFVRDGVVTEGTSANVFAVLNGRLITHPEGSHILPGVTRRLVMALAEREGIPVSQETLPKDDLLGVDELFISGTTTEVTAVVSVDGQRIGGGSPGPITKRLQAQFDKMVDQVRAGEKGLPFS